MDRPYIVYSSPGSGSVPVEASLTTFRRKIDEPLRGSRIACPADFCKVARIWH
jgi:hypothetical protein